MIFLCLFSNETVVFIQIPNWNYMNIIGNVPFDSLILWFFVLFCFKRRKAVSVFAVLLFHWPARHRVPVIGDAEVFCEVVCATDQRKLDKKMVEQQHLETSPLFLPGLWLVLHTHTSIYMSVLRLKHKHFQLKQHTHKPAGSCTSA